MPAGDKSDKPKCPRMAAAVGLRQRSDEHAWPYCYCQSDCALNIDGECAEVVTAKALAASAAHMEAIVAEMVETRALLKAKKSPKKPKDE
jgi:hypothetical protein